jgi:hypothetical protein
MENAIAPNGTAKNRKLVFIVALLDARSTCHPMLSQIGPSVP